MKLGPRADFVEVGEAATDARHRVLLEVGVAVQVHVGKVAAGVVNLAADGLSERPGDEAEVAARRLPKTADEGGAGLELRGLRRHT